MASPKALLVILLIAFANAKIINGLPVDIDDDEEEDITVNEELNNYDHEEDSGEDSNVMAHVSEGGVDEMDLRSFDHEEESEVSEAQGIPGSQSTTKSINIVGNGDFNMGGNYNSGGISIQTGSTLSLIKYGDEAVRVTNNDIDEMVTGMTSTSSTMFDKRVLIGNSNSGKMIWSDNPTEIVIVEENTCKKMAYKQHVLLSSEILSTADCAKVMEKIKQIQQDSHQLSEELSHMGHDIEQSVQQSMQAAFGPGFPFNNGPKPTGNNNNYNGMNFNGNYDGVSNSGSPFGNSWPFGPNNSPFGSNNWPFGPNNSPFGSNNWPLGPNNSPFGSNSGNSGNTGDNGNSGRRRTRRTSRRRVPYQPDVNNFYN